MNTRAQLIALIQSLILSGGRRTTAQNIRDALTVMIQSLINILDDKDINGGYLGIESSGNVNISFINNPSPAGLFLRDDGTWEEAPRLVFTGTITQVLDSKYSAWVFAAGAGVTWTLPAVAGNKVYRVINRSSNTLTVNYPGGSSLIYNLSSGASVNALSLTANTQVTLIDDGSRLISF